MSTSSTHAERDRAQLDYSDPHYAIGAIIAVVSTDPGSPFSKMPPRERVRRIWKILSEGDWSPGRAS